jgi:hypothetical protein
MMRCFVHDSGRGLCAIIALGLLGSCSGHPLTDEALIATFEQNKAVFRELVSESYASAPSCLGPRDSDICVPTVSHQLKAEWGGKVKLPIKDLYIDRRHHDSLWIPVQTYGYLSISSSTRGYVFCRNPLAPITRDTLAENRNGYSFRPIGDGWMLYIAN